MAFIGRWLHFSYSDMLDMDLNDFISFVNKTKEIVTIQNDT